MQSLLFWHTPFSPFVQCLFSPSQKMTTISTCLQLDGRTTISIWNNTTREILVSVQSNCHIDQYFGTRGVCVCVCVETLVHIGTTFDCILLFCLISNALSFHFFWSIWNIGIAHFYRLKTGIDLKIARSFSFCCEHPSLYFLGGRGRGWIFWKIFHLSSFLALSFFFFWSFEPGNCLCGIFLCLSNEELNGCFENILFLVYNCKHFWTGLICETGTIRWFIMASEWFNVAALLIMFREALEAAIIIAVLLQLVAKLDMKHVSTSM